MVSDPCSPKFMIKKALCGRRPIGSMYVPNMVYTAAGPITSAATNFIRIAFSEPISGLDITQFNVTLTASPDTLPNSPQSNSRKLMQVPLSFPDW